MDFYSFNDRGRGFGKLVGEYKLAAKSLRMQQPFHQERQDDDQVRISTLQIGTTRHIFQPQPTRLDYAGAMRSQR